MASPTGGWTGKLLDVDLTSGKVKIASSVALADRFLGGSGLGQAIIFDQIPVGTGPLDPENVVVFDAGPLTGTGAPASARLCIDTMNALTGGVNFSNAGGHFAPELKFAGFDAVVVRGRARTPVYLQVVNDQARLVDARHLWGKTTGETVDAIRAEMGDQRARVLNIGPAGENLVKAACVIVDRARAAGRGGVGAVLGAKNLKAIAVRGTQPVRVARPQEFLAEVDRALAKLENEHTRKLRRHGTFNSLPGLNSLCRVPYRNNQDDYVAPERLAPVLPDVFADHFRVRKLSCFNCPKVCSNWFAVREGDYAGTACEGFHQNYMEDYVCRLDVNDPSAIVYIQHLCSELGLDIDSSSVELAWAFECFERGLLTLADTEGRELRWGDHHTIVWLLRQLAYRKGLGAMLAEGVRAASRRVGPEAERLAMHVKGQELQETVRAAKGWAFGVMVSTRGGTHMDGAPANERWDRPPEFFAARYGNAAAGDTNTLDGKPESTYYYDRFKAVVDSLGLCYIATAWISPDNLWPEDLAALLSAATGRDYSGDDLMLVGRRIFNLKKAFNTLHQGFTRRDDLPPARVVEEPIRSGPAKGARLELEAWHKALDHYYELHGWDIATGWQTEAGLAALGLPDVAKRLRDAGRLP